MRLKYLPLDSRLYRYLCQQRTGARDPVLQALQRETAALGRQVSKMQISPDQGSLLTLLVAALEVRAALEVGTFTGYSSICIARGLRPGGRLLCLDQSPEWTQVARQYWARAGVANRIELRLGPAIPALQKLGRGARFDFAFIDAQKTEYDTYYELVLPHVRRNGVMVFDNMLWGGRLGRGPLRDPAGRAIDRLNRKLSRDPRVQSVLVSVADGLQVCRKK
ncbi:MAG: O-methyltransferase [Verrucomicrobia bacterium]|nr:O-methyltransferase [Verrucomicrobiota bacterium]